MTRHSGRWTIALMSTLLMLCLGTVYAWSFFQDLLIRERGQLYGWTNSQVAWIFSLAIFFLGENFTLNKFIGTLLISGGIYFISK